MLARDPSSKTIAMNMPYYPKAFLIDKEPYERHYPYLVY